MDTSLLYLLLEDGLSLALVVLLFYLKQRPFLVLALVLIVLMLVSNVLYFKMIHAAFIGGFPLLVFAFAGPALGRFNTRLPINNAKTLKMLLIIFLLLLLFCILCIIIIAFILPSK